MDAFELTVRLAKMKMKKTEFARKMGMKVSTLYHWKEAPGYAVALLEALENVEVMRVELGRKK